MHWHSQSFCTPEWMNISNIITTTNPGIRIETLQLHPGRFICRSHRKWRRVTLCQTRNRPLEDLVNTAKNRTLKWCRHVIWASSLSAAILLVTNFGKRKHRKIGLTTSPYGLEDHSQTYRWNWSDGHRRSDSMFTHRHGKGRESVFLL